MGKGTKAKARHGTSRLQRSTPSRLLKALCPPHLPSSCQVSRLSFPHSLSRILLLHLCSRQISQIFSHLRSRLSIKSPRVQLFQVASSPYRHSLFFVCLVFRCASVSPRLVHFAYLALSLQTFSASSSSSRLSRESLAQVPEHLQRWVTWLLVLRGHRNFFIVHLTTRSSPRSSRTNPLYGLAQRLAVLLCPPIVNTFSFMAFVLPSVIKSYHLSSIVCHFSTPPSSSFFFIIEFDSHTSRTVARFITLQTQSLKLYSLTDSHISLNRSPVRFFDNINAKMKSVVIALCTFVAATAAQGSPNLAACGVSNLSHITF